MSVTMKDSRVPWIGIIPENWEMRKISRSFAIIGSGTTPAVTDSSFHMKGTIPWVNTGDLNDNVVSTPEKSLTVHVVQKYSTLRLYPVGTLLVAMYGATIGKIGILGVEACTNQACCALAEPKYFGMRFIYYWFLDNRRNLVTLSYGGGQPNINQDIIRALRVQTPAIPEQQRIAAYLDEQTAKIDRLMDMRRRQMALLKEQRAALIQEAVTHGLNPNAPMKDSGLPWLGEIPVHWQTTRLAHHTTRIGDGLHGTPEYIDESPYRFINGNNLSGGVVTITPSTGCISEVEFQKYRVNLGENTLLMSINGTIGSVAYYEGELIILGKSAAYINCAKGLSRQYLFYFLQSKSTESFFQLEVTGTTIFNLSLTTIRNLPIVLPSLDEQKQIVDFIEMRCVNLDQIYDSYTRQLTLLTEYRAALIHECVTGQRTVPEVSRSGY